MTEWLKPLLGADRQKRRPLKQPAVWHIFQGLDRWGLLTAYKQPLSALKEPCKMENEEIHELEMSLDLDSGFFNSLLKEDDWAFVIKLHALIEAAVTHLLSQHLDDKRLEEVFSYLELGNQRSGKIAFLQKLELISSSFKRYIMSLSELRNSLVHDVKNVKFKFKDMISEYTEKDLNNFIKRFGIFIPEENLRDPLWDKYAREDPKSFIWTGTLSILLFVYNRKTTSYYESVVKAVKLAQME